MGPSAEFALSINFSVESEFSRSAWTTAAFPPFCLIVLASASASDREERACRPIAKPSAARYSAIARPMRRAAPVINTVFGIISFKANLRPAYASGNYGYRSKGGVLHSMRVDYTELSRPDAFEVI